MKKIVLWPSYFDIRLKRREGRRVPKSLAVNAPTVEELAIAAKNLGLSPEVEHSKSYPSTPWVKGRVFVSKTCSKQETIRKVGMTLKTAKSGQS